MNKLTKKETHEHAPIMFFTIPITPYPEAIEYPTPFMNKKKQILVETIFHYFLEWR